MITYYNIALDLYPLIGSFPIEGSLLATRLENSVNKLLFSKEKNLVLKEILLLLSLAYDLNYLGEEPYYFLRKKILLLINQNKKKKEKN